MWQGCYYILDHSWNTESLWSWIGSVDPWSNRGYHPFQEDPYWMGGEYHHLPLQRQECRPWEWKLSRPQREGGRELSTTTSAHQWHARMFASYKKISMLSTRHCTWPLSNWIMHLIVYPHVLCGGLFASLACWLKRSVWKWMFTKAHAWAPYCTNQFWKTCPQSFIQDFHGKTCMQMTWSSSLNRWRNCKRSWSFGRLTRKARDFGSTWAKPRSWYLGQGLMCFRSPTKTPVPCVSRASAQTQFSVVVVPVGSTGYAVVSLAL